ncbi:cold-shock protein [Porifericola rhodea]|uniref:cold-shock protein n=1 Tax=Porifericola rhodea TaxID=930972 RepID=UPI00266625BD|nr:cold-shock protein [Porifericola rhodea]WKN31312.1 cold-shock protein [Porifericola rhodea]
MARSQNSFMKKQREKKKQKKKEDKLQRKQERQESSSGELDDMIAYVDEFGNISSTPPEEQDEVTAEDIDQAGTKN